MRPPASARLKVLLTAVIVAAMAGDAAAAPVEPLGHAGRWIIDARGRVVVLHGFNTVPVNEATLPRDMGMSADNARWLAENGFNTIRLGLYHARVEPQPGVFDDAYVDDYVRVQEELAREGIFTLLEFHQDQLNPRYGVGGVLPSRGFADWFLRDDGFPNPSMVPYPAGYLANPALNRAYDNLWRDFPAPDGESVHEHFARSWEYLIERFGDRPGILGYDLFNEPWPGTVWPSCAVPAGCPPGGFDQTLLTDFTRETVARTRAADPVRLIFYEPNLLFDYGAQTAVGDPGDPNTGFAYHDYCIGIVFGEGPDPLGLCGIGERLPIDNAEAHSRRTGDALILSEFGFEADDAERVTQLADEYMLSWQRWDYYGDFDAALVSRLDSLVRPYPQVVAGTPEEWSFDRETRTFRLRYSTLRATGEGASLRRGRTAPGSRFPHGSRTEVFIPERHYPAGYRVEVQGARVLSDPGARLLVLASRAGAQRVEVEVTAPGGAPAVSRSRPRRRR